MECIPTERFHGNSTESSDLLEGFLAEWRESSRVWLPFAPLLRILAGTSTAFHPPHKEKTPSALLRIGDHQRRQRLLCFPSATIDALNEGPTSTAGTHCFFRI